MLEAILLATDEKLFFVDRLGASGTFLKSSAASSPAATAGTRTSKAVRTPRCGVMSSNTTGSCVLFDGRRREERSIGSGSSGNGSWLEKLRTAFTSCLDK
mmetsp:Transcript_131942/g.320644  ORF Transcript_131942/g.320644 Transcript_131942/m.320644 type:complete len:100 (+) Transcript_131942:171-470(+)